MELHMYIPNIYIYIYIYIYVCVSARIIFTYDRLYK